MILWFLIQEFTPERFRKIFFLMGLLNMVVILIGLISFPLVDEIIQVPFEPFPYKVMKHGPGEELGSITIFLFTFSPILLIGIVLYNTTLKLEEKKLRKKGFFYGMGFLFLFLPALICLFISPIYARWGYLVGAILLFKAFEAEV